MKNKTLNYFKVIISVFTLFVSFFQYLIYQPIDYRGASVDTAIAQIILPNDLSITKILYSGVVYPGATIETIIDYVNNGTGFLSGIRIQDRYSNYLIFSGVVSSNPNVLSPPITFSHDVNLRTSYFDNISLSGNTTGQIILKYIVSGSLPENINVINTGTISIGCVLCQDPYTFNNSGFSMGFIVPRPRVAPPPYDLQLQADISGGNIIYNEHYVDVMVDLANMDYTGDDIMFQISYRTYLLDYVGIVSGSVLSGIVPSISEPNNDPYNLPHVYNHNDITKMIWSGLLLNSGMSTSLIVRFQMINDYTVPIDTDFMIGIPDEYSNISTIGEINPLNNNDVASIHAPSFDLWTTISLLTGDVSNSVTGAYDASGTLTFRIEFGNNGPARDNITLFFDNYDTNWIGYTGNKNYGPIYTGESSYVYIPDWHSLYRTNISLGTGETGYIDVTVPTHPCNTRDFPSRISMLDNYNLILSLNYPWWHPYYLTDRANESDTSNNYSESSGILSDGFCNPGLPPMNDYVISGISTTDTLSGVFIPGEVVTFWIPFDHYYDNYSNYYMAMQFAYDTGLTFLGLVVTGAGNDIGVIDNSSPHLIDIRNNLILSNYGYSDAENAYNDPAGFATGVCIFPSFPTSTPLDNPTPIRPYMQSISGQINNIYISGYQYYKSIGYDDIYSHAFAFIDAQTYAYGLSYSPQADQMIDDFEDRYYPCLYNKSYVHAIQNQIPPLQADIIAQQQATNSIANIIKKPSMFNICNNDILLFFDSQQICKRNEYTLSLFYSYGLYLQPTFDSELDQTLDTAYGASLSTGLFHQLLSNRILPLYDQSRPIARQYSMIGSGLSDVVFCPDILCIDNMGTNNSPSPHILINISYDDYNDIVSAYDTNIYSGSWISWSGGYIETESILGLSNMWRRMFIDDFSQTGKMQISYLANAIDETLKIGLNFVVNEVSSGTILNFTGWVGKDNLWGNYCSIYPEGGDYSRGCLTDVNRAYDDTINWVGGNTGDIVPGDDNRTGTTITVGPRNPYDLTITKTIDISTGSLPGTSVVVTTVVCNSGNYHNDITLVEDYTPGMMHIDTILSGTDIGVPYTVDPIGSRVIRSGISLTGGECKQTIVQYTLFDNLISGSIMNFYGYAGPGTGILLFPNHNVSAEVSGFVIAPVLDIYKPYGNKSIIGSTFYTGDEILYRIDYHNVGGITGIMDLYDVYESGLIFSGVVSSIPLLPPYIHDITGRTIIRSNVTVPPFSGGSIDLSFIISSGKNAFDTIENDFSYSMLFVPENYITDIDRTNNQSSRNGSYYLNIFEGTVLEDINHNALYDITDMPLSGVSVSISQSGILIGTTITSSTGYYIFDSLLPGDYVVSYAPLPGYTTIVSFTGTINNSGSLGLNGVSILSDYPFYSSIATDNITLMDRYVGPVCGNNIIETGEVCDDGSNNGLAGYCNTSCTNITVTSLCGNGTINTGEQCDDGNNNNGDACNAVCQFEVPSCSMISLSYLSTNPVHITFNITGFGFGSMQLLQMVNYGDSHIDLYPSGLSFNHLYQNIGPYTIVATVANRLNNNIFATCNITVQGGGGGGGGYSNYCGDSIVNNSEQCDDGNSDDNDSCTNSCVINDDCSITDDCGHGAPPILPPVETSSGFDIIKIIPRTGAY